MKFTIRNATNSDAKAIYSILLPYSDEGVIIKRTVEDIKQNIQNFFIAETKNDIMGVISYYNYSDNLKEVRSLAVKKKYYKKGVGIALLKGLLNILLEDYPKARIFALSIHPEFFKKSGFVEISKDTLPEKIWKDCQNCIHQNNCDETALLFSN